MDNFDFTRFLPGSVREAMGYNKDLKPKAAVKDSLPPTSTEIKRPRVEITPSVRDLAKEVEFQETLKFNIGGTEVCFDKKAASQYVIFYHEGNAVLVRAGADRGKVERAIKEAFSAAATDGGTINTSYLESAIKAEFIGEVAPEGDHTSNQRSMDIVLVEGKDKSPTGKTRINRFVIGESQNSLVTINQREDKIKYNVVKYSDTPEEKVQRRDSDGMRSIESSVASQGDEVAYMLINSQPEEINNITGGPARAREDHLHKDQGELRRDLSSEWPVGDTPATGEPLMADIARKLVRAKNNSIHDNTKEIANAMPNSNGVLIIK